jgi:outer membrane protein
MRILYIAVFLFVIGILPAKANTTQFSGRFAVVNSERVFNETNLAKSMQETLRTEFLPRQNKLQQEAQSNPGDSTLLARQESFTADLNRRTLEERTKIASLANIQLKEFAKKENISIIVQEAAYLDPSSDITNQIISLLNDSKNINNVVFNGPKNSRVLVVDAARLYQSFGVATGANLSVKEKGAQDQLNAKANEALKLIAESNQINIILQQAAYVSAANDLTDKLIKVVKNKSFEKSNLVINSSNLPTTLAVVNSEEIFSKFPNKNRQKLAEAGNVALNKFSQEKGINVILQEAAYVSPSHDITANVIKLIIPPVENEVGPITNSNTTATSPTKNLADAKAKCLDLGFKVGTEAFGSCVLKLSK